MSRICEITGTGSIKGSHIWRSGKAKKKGGIGTHVTGITKRRFMPNLQRVKALINGEVRYVRVTANALKKGLIGEGRHRPLRRCIVARLTSRTDSRSLRVSRLSNSAFPLPTASATFTR